jgi:hypothetical protein
MYVSRVTTRRLGTAATSAQSEREGNKRKVKRDLSIRGDRALYTSCGGDGSWLLEVMQKAAEPCNYY